MTKKEERACNAFLIGMIHNKNRRLVPATKFKKKAKPGLALMVLPMEEILKGWRKLRKSVEGKSRGK